MQQQAQAAGMPWFARDDYEAFRRVLPDRSWHATYDGWLTAAEQSIQRVEAAGTRAIKAHVRSDEFLIWCAARGLNVNTQALTLYGSEFAARVLMDEAQT